MTTVAVKGRIYVELFWDEDTERWDYAVPELHILGAGGQTKDDARIRAAEAIAAALEARPEARPGSEIVSPAGCGRVAAPRSAVLNTLGWHRGQRAAC